MKFFGLTYPHPEPMTKKWPITTEAQIQVRWQAVVDGLSSTFGDGPK